MRIQRWTARAALSALGALGIAIAHWAAYVMAAPQAHTHHQLLHSTGHRYWPLGGALLVAMVVGTIGFSISKRLGRSDASMATVRGAALALGAIQVGGFLLMEVGERLLFSSHHSVSSVMAEPVVWIGIALQLIIAVAGAVLVRVLLRAAAFVRALIRASVSSARCISVSLPSTPFIVPALSPASSGLSRRGPPLQR